jgi:hypothetical protein
VYANMFPDRVRAMMLEGVVYVPDSFTSAETRTSLDAATTDQVFNQFLTLCDQAGPEKCAVAGHGEPAATRVARLFEQVKLAPIPSPNTSPPDALHYSDLKISSFTKLLLMPFSCRLTMTASAQQRQHNCISKGWLAVRPGNTRSRS